MRLLVGYDGSDGGRDALELTRVLAEALNASVMVVAVIPYGPLPVPYEMLEDEEAERAHPRASCWPGSRSRPGPSAAAPRPG